MSDPVTELVKAHLKQLRLPAMAQELERLSREAAASNQNYEQFLLRLGRGGAGGPGRQRAGGADQERGVPGGQGLRHLRLHARCPRCPSRSSWSWRSASGSIRSSIVASSATPGRGRRTWPPPWAWRPVAGACGCGSSRRRPWSASWSRRRSSTRLDRFLGQLDRADLLICDELGYVSFSRNGVELLFRLADGPLRAVERADHEQPGVRATGGRCSRGSG